jgi:hypothetical protein
VFSRPSEVKRDIQIFKAMSRRIESFSELPSGNHLLLEKYNDKYALFLEVDNNLKGGRYYAVQTEKVIMDKYCSPETALPDNWQSAGTWLECKEKKNALAEFEKLCNES